MDTVGTFLYAICIIISDKYCGSISYSRRNGGHILVMRIGGVYVAHIFDDMNEKPGTIIISDHSSDLLYDIHDPSSFDGVVTILCDKIESIKRLTIGVS